MSVTSITQAYQDLNQRFIKLVNDLSTLRGLSAISMRTSSQEDLLREAMRVLLGNSDFARCSIFLLHDDMLSCSGGMDLADLLRDTKDKPRHSSTFKLGEGIIGMAAETGNLQHCRDCTREARFVQTDSQHSIGSLISVPILFADKTLGVVNVSHQRKQAFNDDHERLLTVFASFLGQIISNWRYFHKMEAAIENRTHELKTALDDAEELKRRYQHLSVIDELTGIHNRRFFFPEAYTALASAVRYQHTYTLMMVDLDRFKQINDDYGHDMGDKVLQVTAALLKGQTREGDITARFGGEEFVLALPHTDLQGAQLLAGRILHSLRNLCFNAGDKSVQVTASIGISCLCGNESPDQPDLLESLLRQADQALYYCKAQGRNQHSTYNEISQHLP